MSRSRSALRLVTGPRLLRSGIGARGWQLAITRALPAPRRARVAGAVADRMTAVGNAAGAAQLLLAVSRQAGTAVARDQLRVAAARAQLAAGETPDELGSALSAGLQAVDGDWKGGRRKEAATQLADVLNVAFHRVLHFDGLTSPLAEDPAGYLAPLRASTAMQRASAPRGRTTRPSSQRRCRKLLVLSYKNWRFMPRIVDRYGEHDGVQVRRVELDELDAQPPLSVAQLTRERLLGPGDARSRPWGAALAEHLDWCDTVWMEWGQRGAVALSLLDPGNTRVIVRVHSYEAFTAFPHLLDWSRVDDVVFVGDHVRAFLEQVVPAVADGPNRHVLPNAMDLAPFASTKNEGADRTLALVGWSAIAKDPLWAVDLLARLRADDGRYRLLLVGGPIDPSASPAAAAYAQRFEERIARADVAGAVQRLGHTDDVAAALTDVGVILSSSVRESFHQSVVEGAASHAVPVVRNWPMYAAYGGARAVFPDDWVVDDINTAAERVLALTRDVDVWRAAGADAAATALARYDWSNVAPSYDALLRTPM